MCFLLGLAAVPGKLTYGETIIYTNNTKAGQKNYDFSDTSLIRWSNATYLTVEGKEHLRECLNISGRISEQLGSRQMTANSHPQP